MRRAAQSLHSGGFADGQGLAAALYMGACVVNMATRFLCTIEIPIHPQIKKAITEATESDMELMLKTWRNTNRIFKNDIAKRTKRIGGLPELEFEDVQHLVAEAKGRRVFLDGGVNAGGSPFAFLYRDYRPFLLMVDVFSMGVDCMSSTVQQPH